MTNYITSVGVQQFSITIGSGATTGTATITAVGALAFILMGGMTVDTNSDESKDLARVTLTNSTTITATRNTSSTDTITVTGSIVDATSNLVTSVQYGTVAINNTSLTGTASISAVNNSNAAIHLLGRTASAASDTESSTPAISLSGTTVTAERGGVFATLTVGFVVIEFNGSVLNQNVQNVSASSSSSVTSYTASITSVNTGNSLLIYAGCDSVSANNTPDVAKQYGMLTNGTTITVNVNTAQIGLKKYNCSVVEFKAGVLPVSVQRGTTLLSSAISNTSTITSSATNVSALSWLGFKSDKASSDLRSEGKSVLTNATTVTVSQVSTSTTLTGSWEVIKFSGFVTPSAALLSSAF